MCREFTFPSDIHDVKLTPIRAFRWQTGIGKVNLSTISVNEGSAQGFAVF